MKLEETTSKEEKKVSFKERTEVVGDRIGSGERQLPTKQKD